MKDPLDYEVTMYLTVSPKDELELKLPMELKLPTCTYPKSLRTHVVEVEEVSAPHIHLDHALYEGEIGELNYMIHLLAKLSEEQADRLWAVLELSNGFDYEGYDREFLADEIINLIMNIDDITLIADIDDKSDLGRLVYEQELNERGIDRAAMMYLEEYLDYEEMGEDRLYHERGVIYGGYYVTPKMIENLPPLYDRSKLPDKYRVIK